MIETLFSTPLYYTKVDGFHNIQKEIEKGLDKLEFKYKKHWGETHLLAPQNFNENVLDICELNTLSNEIDKHVYHYFEEIGRTRYTSEYKIVSWFTKCGKGNYAHTHTHGAADISGVYYYKTNNKDGNIFFETPNPHLNTSEYFTHLGTAWDHIPVEGKLLIFPGWLQHGVRTNCTDNTRISLSFNITFQKGV